MFNILLTLLFTFIIGGNAYSFDFNNYNLNALKLSRSMNHTLPIHNYVGDQDPCELAKQDIDLINKFGTARLLNCEVSRKWFILGETNILISYEVDRLKVCFGSFGHILENDLKILSVDCATEVELLASDVLKTAVTDKNRNLYLPFNRHINNSNCYDQYPCVELSILMDYIYEKVRRSVHPQRVLLTKINNANFCLYTRGYEADPLRQEVCLNLMPYAQYLNEVMQKEKIKSVAGDAAYTFIDKATECALLPEDMQYLQESLQLGPVVKKETVGTATVYELTKDSGGYSHTYSVKLDSVVSAEKYECNVNVYMYIGGGQRGVSNRCDTDSNWRKDNRGIQHSAGRDYYYCQPGDIIDTHVQNIKSIIIDRIYKRLHK